MDKSIFIKRQNVISTFVTPWILGKGIKTPEEAKKYIKKGETLNPHYYELNNDFIQSNGEESLNNIFMKRLFSESNIDYELSGIISKIIYKPWDCLSGIYQIEINEKIGLVARPDGVSQNNEYIIMVDEFLRICTPSREEEIKIKLLTTMAVWKAKKGIYYIKNISKIIEINFDEDEWNQIYDKIKLWAQFLL